MIRMIGGATRTGKGILSRRLMEETNRPFLSLDVIKMGLVNGVPSFGIDPEAPPAEFARVIWPLVRGMVVNMVETGVHYTVEGEMLPEQVHELMQTYPGEIAACFLGYTRITPAEKLRQIRAFSGHPNDWIQDFPDAYVLALVEESIEFSHTLQAECARLGLAYLDVSDDFNGALDRADAILRGREDLRKTGREPIGGTSSK